MSDDEKRELDRREVLQSGTATLLALQTAGLVVGDALTAAPAEAQPSPAPPGMYSVAHYVLARLAQHNCKVMFGIPGKTCEDLIAAAATRTPGIDLKLVVTTTDAEAAFAADGYARTRGLGAVAVTYGVGTLSLVAAVAGAYVERSPVVVINGGPSNSPDITTQQEDGTYFTHGIGRINTDIDAMRPVTAYAERVAVATDATRVIDAAIMTALREQRPVYIEIAKDVWGHQVPAAGDKLHVEPPSAPTDGATAQRILEMLGRAARPAILLGVEVQRFGMADEVKALVTRLSIPYATTLLSKSVIADDTPGFIGVYGGTSAPPSVRAVIEDSDCLLTIGCVLGRSFRYLVQRRHSDMIRLTSGNIKFGRSEPQPAGLATVLAAMRQKPFTARPELIARTRLPGLSFDARRGSIGTPARSGSREVGLGYDELARTVSNFMSADFVAVSDTSLSMYPLADINVIGRGGYLCNAVYQSIGYSLPASLGIALGQSRRPLVICGDGGFQITAQCLSTMVRQRVRAIVIVLDNAIYGIEQLLIDGSYFDSQGNQPEPFLKLNGWKYDQLASALNVRKTAIAGDVASLRAALDTGRSADGPMLIWARMRPHDRPRHIVPS